MMPRYNKSRDHNEGEVFDELRARGYAVEPLDTPCDALVARRGRVHCAEVKNPRHLGKRNPARLLTPRQKAFRVRWKGRGCLHIATTAAELIHQIEECEAG